jgi:glycosyltransferase involved in cell wall biosynthesis
MSNALLEAMAMGRACIASDIHANRSVLTSEEDGLLFKSTDSDDLAAQIIRLLQQPGLAKKLGKNAREKIMTNFSIETISRKYIRLYSQLAAVGRRMD